MDPQGRVSLFRSFERLPAQRAVKPLTMTLWLTSPRNIEENQEQNTRVAPMRSPIKSLGEAIIRWEMKGTFCERRWLVLRLLDSRKGAEKIRIGRGEVEPIKGSCPAIASYRWRFVGGHPKPTCAAVGKLAMHIEIR
jgi:hypothetical protein